MIFWLKTLRDGKVRAAKDQGKKFRSRLAASFNGMSTKVALGPSGRQTGT